MEDAWTHYWPLCSHTVRASTAVWPVRFGVCAGTGEFMEGVGWPVRDLEPLLEGCR